MEDLHVEAVSVHVEEISLPQRRVVVVAAPANVLDVVAGLDARRVQLVQWPSAALYVFPLASQVDDVLDAQLLEQSLVLGRQLVGTGGPVEQSVFHGLPVFVS